MRKRIAGVAALAMSLGASLALGQTISVPDVSGDQLVFIYDARTARVPFLAISNPSDATINVDVAFYPAALGSRLGGGVITLGPAANLVIDPTTDFGGAANGNAGLAVMTPVVSAQDLTPIVPAQPLVGSFTLANVQLGAGFGENPFGRLAVLGNGSRAEPGATVDGSTVRYERFTPNVLMVPVYFNPQSLGPVEQDGNRVLLASFVDQYGTPFNIGPQADDATASFFDTGGIRVTDQPVQINGVLLTNLQALAGGTTLTSSGKVFFDVDAGDGNVFGLFGQALGTFAEGQRMPAVASVPQGQTANVLDCPGGTATIGLSVVENIIWPSSCQIFLDGTTFVDPGVTITIQPGTVIMGRRNPNNPPPTALVFRRGSRLIANGTADQPIVFTSDQPAGGRAPGDWAGLALNGAAPVNCDGGECEAEGLEDVVFGGDDPNDSSGSIRFVRVEFAGRELAPDNELNVFTMNGIGAGTTIEYVQAHMGLDDGHEWFGGTVNARYLVATSAADDLFDWQIGFTGATQYAYGAQNGANLDAAGSRGFEGDNNEDNFEANPRSNPKFCNVTLIGAKGQAGGDVEAQGIFLRRGTIGKVGQAIVTQFNTAGIEIRDAATVNQACAPGGAPTGAILVQESIFFNDGPDGTTFAQNHSSTEGANCQTTDLFADWQANDGVRTNDPGLPAACASFGCTPVPTGDVTSSNGCADLDPFFDDNNYIGAFAPNTPPWTTSPWISYASN